MIGGGRRISARQAEKTSLAKKEMKGGVIRLSPGLYREASSGASAADGATAAITIIGITASESSLISILRGAVIFTSVSIRPATRSVKQCSILVAEHVPHQPLCLWWHISNHHVDTASLSVLHEALQCQHPAEIHPA